MVGAGVHSCGAEQFFSGAEVFILGAGPFFPDAEAIDSAGEAFCFGAGLNGFEAGVIFLDAEAFCSDAGVIFSDEPAFNSLLDSVLGVFRLFGRLISGVRGERWGFATAGGGGKAFFEVVVDGVGAHHPFTPHS